MVNEITQLIPAGSIDKIEVRACYDEEPGSTVRFPVVELVLEGLHKGGAGPRLNFYAYLDSDDAEVLGRALLKYARRVRGEGN